MSEVTGRKQFWNPERLQQAALDELTRHGGSESDVSQLREHFRKVAETNVQPSSEIPDTPIVKRNRE
jgi:hypothetical protein